MTYVVMSGLPGSGKSTLARRLAPRLGVPMVDKDDILEGLFESKGTGDDAWRSVLSREADERFREAALQSGPACLVSWWKHPLAATLSGTPTEWLLTLPGSFVEVHCTCPVELAATRFLGRRRHVGHRDETRTVESLVAQLRPLSTLGPLGLGSVVEVSTVGTPDLDAVADLVAAATPGRA